MNDAAAIPHLPIRDHLDRPRKMHLRDLEDDGRVPAASGGVRQFSNLAHWLSSPGKTVTRAELWEVLNRYEAGRAAMEAHQFQVHCEKMLAHLAAQRWYRRLWRWVTRAPAPELPKLPVAPLEDL